MQSNTIQHYRRLYVVK